MTRLLLFVLLYVIAFLVGFERRARYDEYIMRKPHMQARLRIFAQECLLYNPESVPEEDRDELLPPSTTDSLAFNAALAMRAVRERQVELDSQLEDVAASHSGEPPDPASSSESSEHAGGSEEGLEPEGSAPVDEFLPEMPSVPVDEADAVTSFDASPGAPAAEPFPESAQQPPADPVYEDAPLSAVPNAQALVDADLELDPAYSPAPPAAPDGASAPASEFADPLDGFEQDDPALSVLEELGEDLPVDGVDSEYEQPVSVAAETSDPADMVFAEPPLPVEPVTYPAAVPAPGDAPGGGAYADLIAAVETEDAGDGSPEPSPLVESGPAEVPESYVDSAYGSLPPGVGPPREAPVVDGSASVGPPAGSDRAVEQPGPGAEPAPSAEEPPVVVPAAGRGRNPALSMGILARQRAAQRAADVDESAAAATAVVEGTRDLTNLGPGVTFTPARSRQRRTPKDT